MPEKTKKEEKKPGEVKKPEIINIQPKKVGYKNGKKSFTYNGDKNDRRK